MSKKNEGRVLASAGAAELRSCTEEAARHAGAVEPAPLTRAQIESMQANVRRLKALREQERGEPSGDGA